MPATTSGLEEVLRKIPGIVIHQREGACQAAIVSVQQGDLYDLHRNPEEANRMDSQQRDTVCDRRLCTICACMRGQNIL